MITPMPEAADLDAELSSVLRERGMRVTSQRLVIHRLVRERDAHVSAEQVLDAVGRRLPGTSLPTVYSTLELLERLGSLRRVSAPGGPILFDPRRDEHQHLICRACGAVEDLDVAVELEPALAAARGEDFVVDHAEVVVTGLCRACRA